MTGEPARHGAARRGTAAASAGPGHPMPEDPMPGDAVPRDPVPRDPVPRNPVPRDPVPQDPVTPNPAPQAPAREPSNVRRLCAIVLIMETVVIWLSIPVALAVNHASPSRIGVAGVFLAVAAVVLAALARRRPRWTIIGGSVLQVLVIAAGVIVPVMYFLGAIFAALWVIGIGLGRRLDATP
jgi:Protein of unknown function (DUF4233)